jgi:hypothetical protein
VRYHDDAIGIGVVRRQDAAAGHPALHHHQRRAPDQPIEDVSLAATRLARRGVQDRDQRSGQPTHELEDVLTVLAAEQPVLVLQQHRIEQLEALERDPQRRVIPGDPMRHDVARPFDLLLMDHTHDPCGPTESRCGDGGAEVAGERRHPAHRRRVCTDQCNRSGSLGLRSVTGAMALAHGDHGRTRSHCPSLSSASGALSAEVGFGANHDLAVRGILPYALARATAATRPSVRLGQ